MIRTLLIFLIFATIQLSFFSKIIYAHPGNTDIYGCHTCRTNCPSWGLSYGEYHCHTPKYTTPTCPLFSSYNSLSGSCECYSGYISSGGQCISEDQNCKNQFGYNSRYNSLYNKCECSYGYVVDTSGKCASGNSICWNKYGYNSKFNSLNNTCECRYGYVFNQSGNKCVSEDEACKEQFGYGAKATISGDKCECRSGYIWEGNNCVLETSDTISIPNPIRTNISTPKPSISASPSPTTSITIDSKTNTGSFFQLWNLIKKFFGL